MTATNSTLYTSRYHHLMREFPLHPLRNKKDAAAATVILDRIFRDRYEDPGEEAYALILAGLLEDYEEKNDPTPDTATGLNALKYLMQANDLTQTELGKILGTRQSLVSMILSGDLPITLDHARRLAARFGISAATFVDLH
jgi:HTH-type transcriptional regulator / antitoxin HigA